MTLNEQRFLDALTNSAPRKANGGKQMSHQDRMEFFGAMIDVIEDWLKEKKITADDIPCKDRDDAIEQGDDPDGLAIIYGEDYDYLTGKFEEMLVNEGLLEEDEW